MRHRLVGASVMMVLLAGSIFAADGLKSGPQVGSKKLPPFHPLNVTGDDAGGRACLI